jgi:hypothetical protein
MGYRARDAVIQAIEAAAIGRNSMRFDDDGAPSSDDPIADHLLKMHYFEGEANRLHAARDKRKAMGAANEALVHATKLLAKDAGNTLALALKSRIGALKLEILASTGTPAGSSSRPPLISSRFPVDPSEVAVVAMEIIGMSPSWQIAHLDNTAVREASGGATSPDARPGARLVGALLDLTNDDPTNSSPRANDHARLVKTDVDGYGEIDKLEAAVVRSLKHLFAGSESEAFVRELAEHLVDGTDEERRLAATALQDSGIADPGIMEEVVERLFAMSVMTEEVEDGRDPGLIDARRSLRQRIRTDAIASLMWMSNFVNDRDRAKQKIGHMVAERAAALMENQARGLGGDAEERFFSGVRSMIRRSSGNENAASLDRGNAYSLEKHAETFERAFTDHLNTRIRAATRTPEEAARLRTMLNEHMRN